jgi:sacsin
MRKINIHLVDTETEQPLENSSIQRQCYAYENNSSWKLYIKHTTGETQAIPLSYCIDRIARWIFDDTCLPVISSMLLCKSPSQLPGFLDQLNIAEDFSDEERKIGGEVPVVFHYLLQQNPLCIFHEGESVAYGIETNETDEMAEVIEDGFMIMKFVLAKVISRTDETESDGSYDFTAKYLIDLGNERKKVSVVDLYRFVQNDATENHTTDLTQFTGDPTIVPSSLDDGKREIWGALLRAWRLPQKLRQKVIRRLYLRWHPDKNPDNVAFAEEMMKFLLSEIKRMEAEESNIDDSCKFSTMFTGWNRRARRERDT